MNDYFKRFIICFCILGLFVGPLRPQRASAFFIADDAIIVIGGVAVTLYVCVEILIQSGHHLGYESVSTNDYTLKDYLKQKVFSMSAAALMDLFCFKKDSNNQDYLAVKNADFTEINSLFDKMLHSDYVAQDFSTSNTTYNESLPEPYMLNGYYMIPYKVGADGTVYQKFKTASDWVTIQYSDYKGVKVYTSPSYPTWIRFFQESGNVKFQSSSDGVNWYSFGYCYLSSSHPVASVGYIAKSVVIPGDSIIKDTGIETNIDRDSTIAYPISAQYNTSNQKVYDGIEGASAGVVSNLKVSDLSNTNTGTDAGVDTQTGFWDKLWDWLKEIIDGITSIPHLILDWFTIDWDKVKTHINYIDIVKQHFQPIYDIFDLISNVSADIKDSDGKFYMVIPHEMGGDDKEHCVLDLSVGAIYITTARDVIKYGMWMGFVWYVLRKFDPKFSI